MNPSRTHRLYALAACAILAALPCTFAQNAPTTAPSELPWQKNYDTALAAARQSDKPLLVVFGAPWCEWCRKLSEEFKIPEVKKELAAFERVYLDFDDNRELAAKLGVGPIPALRLVKPSGRILSVRDGFLPTDQLLAWLHESQKSADASKLDPALDADDLSADTIAKLIALFGNPEVAVRESSIRRLLSHRDKAAPLVVKSFASGSLAVRLTALDLLDSWKAPTTSLDPWRAETLTKERLAQLEKWAATPESAATTTAPALDPAQRAQAHDMIAQMLKGSDQDAASLRERLARYGPALLPEIYVFIKDASSDADRQRLTWLRYRVAASDVLALQWPGGLERLASLQVKTRHSALDELASRASPRDTGLLLELFSDPDALVRETALRLLQKTGGDSATAALVNLLSDPDPNVRAAVLKSVAEAPSAQITAKIADYITQEKDPDLIVHAARVLRNSKSPAAAKTLYTLLDHPSWRIRAEAAEALAEKSGRSSDSTPEQRADFYVRMLKLLEDPDGFVASRALTALERAEGLPTLAPVAKAAEKHPQLAILSVKIIAANLKVDPKGAEYLRAFLSHKEAPVRASAVASAFTALGESAVDDIHKAFADPDERVRIATADALFEYLETLLPQSRDFSDDKPVDLEAFLTQFHSGKNRPAWLNSFRPDLDRSLASPSSAERFHAALPLIALGYRERALPLLKEQTAADANLIYRACPILTWLPWDDRLALFNQFRDKAPENALSVLAQGIAVGANPKAADPLWQLLELPSASWSTANYISSPLRLILLGSEYRTEPALKKLAVETLSKRVASGNPYQKTLALVLLSSADPVCAFAELSGKIVADPNTPADLRRDTLQIQLTILEPPDAQSMAANHLASDDPLLRNLALEFLGFGSDATRYLRGSIYLSQTYGSSHSSGTPIMPTPPRGLTVARIKPILEDKNPKHAAIAGYLLALLRDRSGLDKLLAYYRINSSDHDDVCKMVYRAITVLDDDSLTPTLAEIYTTLAKSGSYEIREFYWTIRSMTGDKCIALRKRMRDEMGMEALR